MLKIASSHGFVRSSYTLGIVLRDALPEQATHFMELAASTGYLPAMQELLTAREMKERFGEPNADALRRYLDPVCLNRLLLRDYVDSAELRGFNTSHCWNPLCGKWAYKATNPTSAVRIRRPLGLGQQDIQEDVTDDGFAASLSQRPLLSLRDGNEESNNINDRAISGSDMIALPDNSKPCVTLTPKKSPFALAWEEAGVKVDRVARMKMCSRCCRAKYCSKLCQVYDWRSSQHKQECQFL